MPRSESDRKVGAPCAVGVYVIEGSETLQPETAQCQHHGNLKTLHQACILQFRDLYSYLHEDKYHGHVGVNVMPLKHS